MKRMFVYDNMELNGNIRYRNKNINMIEEIMRRRIVLITVEELLSKEKVDLMETARTLTPEDLALLVDWLSEKDDKIRYQSLLVLQNRMKFSEDVYPYWDVFHMKLKSNNSYQRSIGLLMIAGNVKWDKYHKFNEMFEDYFAILQDDKPITVRQCIQSLHEVIPYAEHLHKRIADVLMAVDILQLKETMQKLILQDIIEALLLIKSQLKYEKIDQFISDAITGNILDKKTKKKLESGW